VLFNDCLAHFLRNRYQARSDGIFAPYRSEMEIAEILNTSRATVREALAQLERDRVIIRKQGSRTYINPTVRHLTSTFNELLDPETFIISQGYNYLVSFFNTEKTIVT
jgi:DNA-binding GntR family transcriptional regulator